MIFRTSSNDVPPSSSSGATVVVVVVIPSFIMAISSAGQHGSVTHSIFLFTFINSGLFTYPRICMFNSKKAFFKSSQKLQVKLKNAKAKKQGNFLPITTQQSVKQSNDFLAICLDCRRANQLSSKAAKCSEISLP